MATATAARRCTKQGFEVYPIPGAPQEASKPVEAKETKPVVQAKPKDRFGCFESSARSAINRALDESSTPLDLVELTAAATALDSRLNIGRVRSYILGCVDRDAGQPAKVADAIKVHPVEKGMTKYSFKK